jgi:hypothetical protein
MGLLSPVDWKEILLVKWEQLPNPPNQKGWFGELTLKKNYRYINGWPTPKFCLEFGGMTPKGCLLTVFGSRQQIFGSRFSQALLKILHFKFWAKDWLLVTVTFDEN